MYLGNKGKPCTLQQQCPRGAAVCWDIHDGEVLPPFDSRLSSFSPLDIQLRAAFYSYARPLPDHRLPYLAQIAPYPWDMVPNPAHNMAQPPHPQALGLGPGPEPEPHQFNPAYQFPRAPSHVGKQHPYQFPPAPNVGPPPLYQFPPVPNADPPPLYQFPPAPNVDPPPLYQFPPVPNVGPPPLYQFPPALNVDPPPLYQFPPAPNVDPPPLSQFPPAPPHTGQPHGYDPAFQYPPAPYVAQPHPLVPDCGFGPTHPQPLDPASGFGPAQLMGPPQFVPGPSSSDTGPPSSGC